MRRSVYEEVAYFLSGVQWLGIWQYGTRVLGCCAIKNLLFVSIEQKVDDKQPYLCFLRDCEGEFFIGRGVVGCHVGAPRRTSAANVTAKGSDWTPRRIRPITNKIPSFVEFALSWRKEDVRNVIETYMMCNN